MKLSIREKIMLIVLGIAALLAGFYYLILEPQLNEIQRLAAEKNDITLQVEAVKAQEKTIEKFKLEMENLISKINEDTKTFYPAILQDRLIILLDNLVKEADVYAGSQTFSRITIGGFQPLPVSMDVVYPLKELTEEYNGIDNKADIVGSGLNEDTQSEQQQDSTTSKGATVPNPEGQASESIESMSISMELECSFEKLMKLIKALEGLERNIVIENISASSTKQGEDLTVAINIKFYALPKISLQDEEYLDWKMEGNYGRENPFIPYSGFVNTTEDVQTPQ